MSDTYLSIIRDIYLRVINMFNYLYIIKKNIEPSFKKIEDVSDVNAVVVVCIFY